MRFKEFLKLCEDDKGLMGYGKPSPGRKPSDGIPFSKYLSSVSGSDGAQGASQQSFMKKKMKKS